MRIFRLGDEGPEVHDIQQRLMALGCDVDPNEIPGRFGDSTESAVREFQAVRSLRVDGLVGPETWAQLVEAGWELGDRTLYLRLPHFLGDDVRGLQRKLNSLGFDAGKDDGLFGPNTDRAVREFQRNVGEEADGIVGAETLGTIERMRPQETGTSRAVVRETEALHLMRSTSIEGQIVAIDPGEGPGGVAAAANEVIYATAVALAEELARMGAKPALLRNPDEELGPSERARAANEMGASVCLSLFRGNGVGKPAGARCSYFGSGASHSPAGMILAELILEELQHRLGCPGELQRLTGSMLRETRMPAVQIEPPTPAHDDPGGAEAAERAGWAIAAGVRRFFSG